MLFAHSFGCFLRLLGAAAVLLAVADRANANDIVELPVGEGRTATASFHPGERGPAVLLLHGFLQTREYLTVSALRAGLADQGYTVLAPTLSLGIDRRKASLACEAVHTHQMADDLAEIAAWIAWLQARGHRDIALVGHSNGARQLLAYVNQEPLAAVRQVVAVGLIGAEDQNDPASHRAHLLRARRHLGASTPALDSFELSYCNRYVATPESFASYAGWDNARVLAALPGARVPVTVILGDADSRMPPAWPRRLREQGARVALVPGAGHFFHAHYEFDLLDEVIAALEGAHAREL